LLTVEIYVLQVERWINYNELIASKFNFTSNRELIHSQIMPLSLSQNVELENANNKNDFSIIQPPQAHNATLLYESRIEDFHLKNEFSPSNEINTQKNQISQTPLVPKRISSLSENQKNSESNKTNENDSTKFHTGYTTPNSKKEETEFHDWDILMSSDSNKKYQARNLSSNSKRKFFQVMDSKSAQITAAKLLDLVQANALEEMKNKDGGKLKSDS